MENIVLFWLFPRPSNFDDLPIEKEELRKYFHDIRIDDDPNICIDTITSFTAQYCFLVLVDDQASMVESLSALTEQTFIYINGFSENVRNRRIRGIFPDAENLLEQLRKDVRLLEQSQSIFKLRNLTSDDCEVNDDEIKCSKLLFNVLLNMRRPRENCYQEVFDQCRRICQNDAEQLEEVERFSTSYETSTSIQSYTKDSMIFRLINMALRANNVLTIYRFRSIIQDIYRKFKSSKEMTIYRGQKMFAEELNRLKSSVDRKFSLSSFIWTTKDFQVARKISGCGDDRPLLESVIFEILIDEGTLVAENPAVDRSAEDEEILLSMGTVFLVESISNEEEFHRIRLRATSIDLSSVTQMTVWLTRLTRREVDLEQFCLFKLAWIFYLIDDIDKSERIYETLKIKQNPNRSILNILFDFIDEQSTECIDRYRSTQDFHLSDEQFSSLNDVLSLFEYLPLPVIVEEILRTARKFFLAAKSPTRALFELYQSLREKQIRFIQSLSTDNRSVSGVKDSLIVDGLKQRTDIERLASEFLENSSNSTDDGTIAELIRQRMLTPLDFERFKGHTRDLVIIHARNRRWPKVIESCQIILNRADLTEDPIYIIEIHLHCAEAHMNLDDVDMSLYHYNLAEELHSSHCPSDSHLYARIMISIANLYLAQFEQEKATDYYRKAIESDDPYGKVTAYERLGFVFRRRDNETSRSYYLKALELRKQEIPRMDGLIAMNHLILAQIEDELSNGQERDFHVEKAMLLSENVPEVRHMVLNHVANFL